MKSCNLKSIPCDVLKTSLPQTWHMPRGEKIGGSKADELVIFGYNTQSPQQQPRGLRSTMYNPINSPLPNVAELCQSLSLIDKSCLLLSVIDLESRPDIVDTKFGKFPKGSPVAVQQKLYKHYVLNILDAPEYPTLPVANFMKNTVCTVLDEKKSVALNSIIVTREDSIQIEEMTRLQTNDPKWHKMRKDRLTASVAGDIKRKADNEPLVARLKTTRKVVTESMRHGLSFESVAAAAYVKIKDIYKVLISETVTEFRHFLHRIEQPSNLCENFDDDTECPACFSTSTKIYSFDADFQLVRKASAGKQWKQPKHHDCFFLDQSKLDKFMEDDCADKNKA